MPISLIFLIITGVVFAIQQGGTSSIYLALLMAPIWSVITINAGFASVYLDVRRGKLTRAWLALPALYFGGYAAATIASHIQYVRLEWRVAAANAGKTFAFSPDTQSLAIDEDVQGGASVDLVRNYAIPVVFERKAGQRPIEYLSRRLGGARACQQLRTDPALRDDGFHLHSIFSVQYGVMGPRSGPRMKGICEYTALEAPVPPVVRVSSEKASEVHKGALLKYRTEHIIIATPDTTLRLSAGQAAPLFWLPMPILGCVLGECEAFFGRGNMQALGGRGPDGYSPSAVIARALGLTYAPAKERREALAEVPVRGERDAIQ